MEKYGCILIYIDMFCMETYGNVWNRDKPYF